MESWRLLDSTHYLECEGGRWNRAWTTLRVEREVSQKDEWGLIFSSFKERSSLKRRGASKLESLKIRSLKIRGTQKVRNRGISLKGSCMKGLSYFVLFLWARQAHVVYSSTYFPLKSEIPLLIPRLPDNFDASLPVHVVWCGVRNKEPGQHKGIWRDPHLFSSGCPHGETAAWWLKAASPGVGGKPPAGQPRYCEVSPPASLSQMQSNEMTLENGKLSPGWCLLFTVRSSDSEVKLSRWNPPNLKLLHHLLSIRDFRQGA